MLCRSRPFLVAELKQLQRFVARLQEYWNIVSLSVPMTEGVRAGAVAASGTWCVVFPGFAHSKRH